MLDFPKFGGVPGLERLKHFNTEVLSSSWMGDLRYTWQTPIPHPYPSVYRPVVECPRVMDAVRKIASAEGKSVHVVQKRAVTILTTIKASLSRAICRIVGYLLFKAFRKITKRILVAPAQMKALKEAEQTGIPLIYLPLHRSHLDYLLITWTVWHWRIRLPHVASGDNLNLSGLGWLLRTFGAFFIRRRLNPDDETTSNGLYREVLNTYVVELLRHGMSVEFFLEGTRSRFGKSLLPKNGLISNVVEAVESGQIRDVYLVPVSISYDNVAEGIFYDELMGVRKEKESVLGVIKGLIRGFGMHGMCGTVCMDFGEPVLLTTRLKRLNAALAEDPGHFNLQHPTNPKSYRELLPWHDVSTPHRTLIRAVGYEIVYEAQLGKPISCSSVLALLLLCKYRHHSGEELCKDLAALASEITCLGFEVVGWADGITNPLVAVKEAVAYLHESSELTSEAECIFRVKFPSSTKALMDLAYHKNAAIVPFNLVSMCALAIKSYESTKGAEFSLSDLIERSLSICNLLQCEIIASSPRERLRDRIVESLRYLGYTDEGEQAPGTNQSTKEGKFDVTFYANILLPFLQTQFVVTTHLLENPTTYAGYRGKIARANLTTYHLSTSDLKFIRHFLTKYQRKDDFPLEEALNSDSIYNSLKFLRLKGIVHDDSI
ncbi:Protein ACL-6 a, partial [Aphelenchoides avenae]